jgi:hypothetical protein
MHRDEGFLNEVLKIVRRGADPFQEKFPDNGDQAVKQGSVGFRVPLVSPEHEIPQRPLPFVGMAKRRRRHLALFEAARYRDGER